MSSWRPNSQAAGEWNQRPGRAAGHVQKDAFQETQVPQEALQVGRAEPEARGEYAEIPAVGVLYAGACLWVRGPVRGQ